MNADERQLIAGLFERMRDYGAPEKDRDAEALINQQLRANPDAAYMLVQSVLVQEQTLEAANNRVLELEDQLRRLEDGDRGRGPAPSGGFLGGYWGGRRGEEPRSSVPQVGPRTLSPAYDARAEARSPWGQGAPSPQPQPAAPSGGFMRSALTTAAGVAGGMLVADSIRNMFGGGAHASPHHEAGSGGTPVDDAKYVDDRDNDPGASQNAAYEDDGNDPGFGSGDDEMDI